MNELEAKKIAIIKSNAAPEVKLKAIQKLDSVKNNGESQVSAAVRAEVRSRCEDLIRDARYLIDHINMIKTNAASARTGWETSDYEKVLKGLIEAKKKMYSAIDATGG